MAEFTEVIKQWNRMCSTKDSGISCEKCKIGANVDEEICRNVPDVDTAKLIEKVVMAWAAEHPELQYPTWKEWLEEQRVVVHFDSVSEKGTKVKWELTNKSNCHIPADIAQKLGIEPKEEK